MKKTALFLSATLCAGSLAAQELRNLSYEPANARIGEPVTIEVELAPTGSQVWCGLEILFGDGENKNIRVGDNGANDLRIRLQHTYRNPGEYTIAAEGKGMTRGLKSATACNGRKRELRLVLADPAAEALARKAAELDARERELKAAADNMEREKQNLNKARQDAAARQEAARQEAARLEAAKQEAAKQEAAAKAKAEVKTEPAPAKPAAPKPAAPKPAILGF